MSSSASNARSVVEASMDNLGNSYRENQKTIRGFGSPNNNKGVSNLAFAQDSLNALNRDRDRRKGIDLDNGKIRSDFLGGRAKSFVDSREYNYESNRLQFVNTHDISFNTKSWSSYNPEKRENESYGRYEDDSTLLITSLHMRMRSATLLSQAIAMKPMGLLAVGQFGNTYLLHGELKLHVSRELRTLLARNDPIIGERPQGRVLNELDDQFSSRDKIESLLVNACEESEELLVRAGQKYQLALSIDGDDVRSLYNWVLALSFRAQLIADIGPDAAFDADKLFLVAIDKFDAMMTRGNVHAFDDLFKFFVSVKKCDVTVFL
ncbi:hypothetical protein REPUB_Repub13aG0247200 [Reevesia pubescens]